MIRFVVSDRRWVLGIALLVSAVLGGCEQAKPVVQQNQIITLPGSGFLQDWDTQLGLNQGDKVSSIYILGDTLHIYTQQNFDHVLNRGSGDIQYFNQVIPQPNRLMGTPVNGLDNGVQVTIVATNHTLEEFNNVGELLRSIELNETTTSPPSAYKNMIFIGVSASGGILDAIDLNKRFNMVAWRIMANGAITGSAAVEGETIFAGSQDGREMAFYPDRAPAWPTLDDDRFATRGKIIGDTRADKDVRQGRSGVYFSSTDSVLYCLDPATGKLRWKFYAGTALNTGPQLTDSFVFQFIPGSGLAAIDKFQKQTLNTPDEAVLDEAMVHTARWTNPDAVRLLSVDKQYAYLLAKDNRTILAVNLQTGAEEFRSHRTDLTAFATNTRDATIYAATRRGEVLAIHPWTTPGASGVLVLNAQPLGKPLN